MKVKKTRAITRFVIMAVFAAILAVLAVINFAVPYSENKYNGFIGALDTSMSFEGGTSLVYEIKNTGEKSKDTESGAKDYALYLQNQLYSKYYYNAQANSYHAGNGKYYIVLDIYDYYYDSSSEFADLEVIDGLLNQKTSLAFKAEQKVDATSYLTEKDIKKVSSEFSAPNRTYGVNIEFTEEGTEKFSNLTETVANGSKAIYIYVGGAFFNSLSVSEKWTESSVFIPTNSTNETQAKAYAAQFNVANYSFNFTRLTTEDIINVIDQNKVTTNIVFTSIIMGVIFLLGTALLCVKFRYLGLTASLSMFIASLIYIFLMQAIPNVHISDASFGGMALTYLMGVFMTYYMFNNFAREYANGKRLPASVKFGFTKSYGLMLDVFSVTFVAGFIIMLICPSAISSVGAVVAIGSVVYAFFAILVNKLFADWYVRINGKDAKKYGFKREANVNELS